MTGTTDTTEAASEAVHDETATDASHVEGVAEAHGAETTTETHTTIEHTPSQSGLPQFDNTTYVNQAVWLTISLVLVYFILSRIALPRIGGVLEQRSQAIQRDLDRAADMRTKALEAEEAYNVKLQSARSEAQDIVENTKAKAQADLDQAIAKADAEIAKQAEKSAAHIANMQADAEKDVSKIAKDVSGFIVDAISPASNDGALISKTLTKLLKG